MKKKYSPSLKDKNDWENFTKQMENIDIKEEDFPKLKTLTQKIPKLDLHGCSLDDANNVVKKFITDSFNKNYRKLLIVTGKGSRSKSYDNPYVSKNLNILKNSIPEYIKNDESLNFIINKVPQAERKDGGEGAINVYLKDNKKFITESFDNNYRKLLIVTGKGLRSKAYNNPYISKDLNILRNSVPEYIKNDGSLNSIINKISQAERKDGGEGAINIYLKDKKKL